MEDSSAIELTEVVLEKGAYESFEPTSSSEDEKSKYKTTGTDRTIEFYKLRRCDAHTSKLTDFTVSDFIDEIYTLTKEQLTCKIKGEDFFLWVYKTEEEEKDPSKKKFPYRFSMGITKDHTGSGQIMLDTHEFKPVPMEGEPGQRAFFMIFADGILAMEYNHLGAKTMTLERFIQTSLAQCGFVRVSKCLSRDRKKNIEEAQIKRVRYAVTPTNLDVFNQFSPDYELVRKRNSGDDSIGTIYVTHMGSPQYDISGEVEKLIEYFNRQNQDIEEGPKRFDAIEKAMNLFVRLTGRNKSAVSRNTIKLFTKHITTIEYIEYEPPYERRYLDKESAFTAIEKAYNEKKAVLDISVTFDEINTR